MPATRSSDPRTSHWAEGSVKNLTETKLIILTLLSEGGMTDEQLIKAYRHAHDVGIAPKASDSGIRSRRAELVDDGVVWDSGRYNTTQSGRKSIIWRAEQR